ncbi:hypothetical protein E2C01_035278 [Portunus trituberculatus]|uniref:Uncharacterized protein n=1 Tax=Portunus trituberculatus TaxID=210409 RepID=A0A5B7F9B8_PORTR|nr:hypothetical protein [Portunus trituberculatus]
MDSLARCRSVHLPRHAALCRVQGPAGVMRLFQAGVASACESLSAVAWGIVAVVASLYEYMYGVAIQRRPLGWLTTVTPPFMAVAPDPSAASGRPNNYLGQEFPLKRHSCSISPVATDGEIKAAAL